MTLPTFNPEAKCPQCGGDDISVSYLDNNAYSCQSTYAPRAYPDARPVCHYHSGPHHHRTCRRCGFRWAEAVMAPSMQMNPR